MRSTDAGVSFTDMTDDARTPRSRACTPTSTRSSSIRPTRTSRSSAPTAAWCARTAPTSTRPRDCAARGLDGRRPGRLPAVAVGDPAAASISLNDGLRDAAVPEPVGRTRTNPLRRPARRHPGQRHLGVHRLAARGSSRSAATAASRASTSANPNDPGRTRTSAPTSTSTSAATTRHGGTSSPSRWTARARRSSFYMPLISDPKVGGTMFAGLQHVWRTKDDGGDAATLDAKCLQRRSARVFTGDGRQCGDWVPLGADLTSTSFGDRGRARTSSAIERAPQRTAARCGRPRAAGACSSPRTRTRAIPRQVTFNRIDTDAQPSRFVSGISIDPANPNHAWVSFSGYTAYTPDTPGHVFEVTFDPSTATPR